MTAALGNTAQGTPWATGVDAFVYPQFIGYAMRAPTTNDVYNPGTRWQDNSVNPAIQYFTVGAGLWYQTANTAFGVSSVTGTANQVASSPTTGAVILSTPATFIAPGSIASTTTLTGGTGITATTGNIAASAGNVSASGTVTGGTGVTATTGNVSATAGAVNAGTSMTATLGNITATNGNFVATTAGTGLLLTNSPAASGAAASPVVVNGRSGQATFTTVSIAAAADLTLTITNSAVTASTTQVIYSMSGATTGSALSIKSITNSAGSSAIVVTNGTGATTSTANIVMNFLVLN